MAVDLTHNQRNTLRAMGGYPAKWWTPAQVKEAWPYPPVGCIGGLGMSMRGLWSRGLTERRHGPPAAYKLTKEGRVAARELD